MKRLFILAVLFGVIPVSAFSQTCASTDALCVRTPGDLIPRAKVDELGAIIIPERASPGTPSTGTGSVYFKTDGKFYSKNDSGLEIDLGLGGSGGHVISTATASDAGAFTLTQRSTMTFDSAFFNVTDGGATNDTTFISLNQNLGNETWIVISEDSFSAVNDYTFTGLSNNEDYRIEWHLTRDGGSVSQIFFARFNGESTGQYNGSGTRAEHNTAGISNFINQSQASFKLGDANSHANGKYHGWMQLTGRAGQTANDVIVTSYKSLFTFASGAYVEFNGVGNYRTMVNPLSTILIDIPGATFSGEVRLWKRAPMAVGAATSVPASSVTISMTPTQFVNGGTLSTCVTGSTVTFISASTEVEVFYSGDWESDSSFGGGSMGVLVDGQYPSGYSGTLGVVSNDFANTALTGNDVSFSRKLTITEGPHSYCLTGRMTGAGPKLTVPSNDNDAVSEFGVREFRNVAGTGDVASNGNNTFTGDNSFNETCPVGFTEVSAQNKTLGCIETNEVVAGSSWNVAANECFTNHGGRLPSVSERFISVENYTLNSETNNWEWLDEPGATADYVRVGGFTNNWASQEKNRLDAGIAYRCWIPAASLLVK